MTSNELRCIVLAVNHSNAKFVSFIVNNVETFWLVDCGASVSLVKNCIVKKLGLPFSSENTNIITDISGNVLSNFGTSSVSFSLPNKDVLTHKMIVCGEDLKFDADGLLGLDFFENFHLTLDFASNVLIVMGWRIPLRNETSLRRHRVVNHNNLAEEEEFDNNQRVIGGTRHVLRTREMYCSTGIGRSHIGKSGHTSGSAEEFLKFSVPSIVQDVAISNSTEMFPNNISQTVFNSPKDSYSALDFCNSILSDPSSKSSELITSGVCRDFFSSGKHQNLVRLREDLVIPAFHGCDYSVPVSSRLPAGTMYCQPLTHITPDILVAHSIVDIPYSTPNNDNRTVTVRFLNISPIPQTINRHVPILKLSSVSLSELDVGSLGRRYESRQDYCRRSERLVPDPVAHLFKEYEDIFAVKDGPLKCTGIVKHKINTGNHPPIAKPPYRVPFARKEVTENCIKEMLRDGIIRPSVSPWSAPVVLVEKKTESGENKVRFCIDFRALNSVTKRDFFPIPNIQDTIDSIGGAELFSKLDMTKGYWQVEMEPSDREKTAFSVPWGHYECNRMPFGLVNSPSTWQRLMYAVLSGLTGTHCYVYLDDIIVFSKNDVNEHIQKLRDVFDRIKEAGLTLNLDKCEFLKSETLYLGHIISKDGFRPDPKKIEAIKNYLVPTTVTEIKSFLGLIGYYRRFIPNFAEIALPLTSLTKKNVSFNFDEKCIQSFKILRNSLIQEPILKYPDPKRQFILATDASGFAIGAVLSQIHDGKEYPVAYASRQLTKAEKNYCTTERECLALLWGIKQYRTYLFGQDFIVYTDHQPLKWLMSVKDPSNRLMRWSLSLAEYSFKIEYRPGKKQAHVDALSRLKPIRQINSDEVDIIWNREEIRIAQLNDSNLNDIFNKIYSSKKDEYYCDLDGVLFKRSPDNTRFEDRIVAPRSFINKIIKLYHDLPFAGHMGFDKTYDRIKKRFFWPKMSDDVREYVNACVSCAQRKTSPHRKPALLQKFSTPKTPFFRIAMDVVGPLPVTNDGNKYILTVQDALTKYVEAFPMKDQTADTVARTFIKGIILRYGTPAQLLTDLGTNFTSNLMQSLCKFLQIHHLKTTAYRPQTNGALERFHRTLKDLLSHYIHPHQRDWDEWLPFALAAYSSATHSSTGESPFFLLFGRDMDYPYDEIFRPIRVKYDTDNNYVSEFLQRMKIAHRNAVTNMEKTTDRVHNQFNKGAVPSKIKVGDRVYLFDQADKVGINRKLAKKWIGPFRVIDLKGVNATVKEIHGGKVQKVHVNRLKLCLSCENINDQLANFPVKHRGNEVKNFVGRPLAINPAKVLDTINNPVVSEDISRSPSPTVSSFDSSDVHESIISQLPKVPSPPISNNSSPLSSFSHSLLNSDSNSSLSGISSLFRSPESQSSSSSVSTDLNRTVIERNPDFTLCPSPTFPARSARKKYEKREWPAKEEFRRHTRSQGPVSEKDT